MKHGFTFSRNWQAGLLGLTMVSVMPNFALAQKGDRELGQHLSGECVTCHRLSGDFKGIPPIIGWPEESFVAVMNEYRDKKRPHQVMQTIAGKLSDEEVAALATYFGSLKPN